MPLLEIQLDPSKRVQKRIVVAQPSDLPKLLDSQTTPTTRSTLDEMETRCDVPNVSVGHV